MTNASSTKNRKLFKQSIPALIRLLEGAASHQKNQDKCVVDLVKLIRGFF